MATTDVEIRLDELRDPRIARFLEDHLRDMRAVSPPESKHALDLDGLRRPEIRFWSAWQCGELVGCAALKRLDAHHGELKSMRIAPSLRRQGLAQRMLRHVLDQAQSAGLQRISLETGSMDFFAPARALYAAHGFTECAPFGDYRADPNSVFMTRQLAKVD
jgi:putative acetyltransferase